MNSVATPNERRRVAGWVEAAVARTPVCDIHTHLYEPAFGELLLWGIDELLVYHYLVAEAFRYHNLPYEEFWSWPKSRQADLIWDLLFLKHSPVSEACRGGLTALNALGVDAKKRDLGSLRRWFARRKVEDHVTQVMAAAGVNSICMTNSPFDDLERPVWERGFQHDERFTTALRVDPLLVTWASTVPRLRAWGYQVQTALSSKTFSEVRRFLETWTKRMLPRYLMVSVGPDFRFPGADPCAQLIEKAIVPHCHEFGLPFALMPGVRRAVNPALRLAGDGVGRSDLTALQNLCAAFPENKFAATVLARDNQHELCVLARKFRNLHIFGCWWFLNNPSLIEDMTRMRLEMLGLSFTPQHSDARVLDQIVYKWRHSKRILGRVLTEKYTDLADTGWKVTPAQIEQDVRQLFGGAFDEFCRR
jgi:hypothetical protein